jgi:hypothetical protein
MVPAPERSATPNLAASLRGSAILPILGIALLLAGACHGEGLTAFDLPYAAHRVLRKYCTECHDGKTARGGPERFDILNTEQLIQAKKIVRKAADDSVLFRRVAVKNDPPGTRPEVPAPDQDILRDWINAGAEPIKSGVSGYVVWCITQDLKGLERNKLRSLRYLSFEHLPRQEGEALQAFVKRNQDVVRQALAAWSEMAARDLTIEPLEQAAVFRIQIRELGWERQPFRGKTVNLFDLALLEYPHGDLPLPFLAQSEELRWFLSGDNQVRPVPYVLGDWLLAAVRSFPLASDFRSVLGRGPGEEAAAPPDIPAPSTPQGWLHIRPVDAFAGPTDRLARRDPEDFELDVRVINAKDLTDPPTAKPRIEDGEPVDYWFRANKDAEVEFFRMEETGEITSLFEGKSLRKTLQKEKPRRASELFDLDPKKDLTWEASPKAASKPRLILFAYPRKDLRGRSFPPGEILKRDKPNVGIRDRILHNIYQLPPEDGHWPAPDPDLMIKGTFEFEVVPKKKSPD